MGRYKVMRELGRNQEGGRITYLATDTHLNPPQQVVIKEFRFAASGANWSGFKAYEREISILQQLAHPRIPRYLNTFETKSGFCLVQEYKSALSLAEKRSFTAEEIKKIAVSVLEILVYLQKRTPSVLHRDIKPENILVDRQLKAYLVDFGFARIRGGKVAISSVAAGTPGFMPPEEQFGRTLTEASDLYSLGATLICLLTGTRSQNIGNLIDHNYRFNVKKLLPHLNPRFIAWLEKMVAPNLKQRFNHAAVALVALQPIQVVGGATYIQRLWYAITPQSFKRNDSRKTHHLLTVLLCLVVILLIALGLSLFRTNTETTTTASSSFYYSVIGLGTLGGDFSEANDLNDAGQVVGGSTINNPNFTRHAFLWDNGTMTDLGTLGGKSSHAHGINNQGQVVGNSDTSDDFDGGARHAFLWNNNTMTALGTLGGKFSFAFDINDTGQVVGNASTSSGTHAFLWENGTMADLSPLVGDKHSDAKSINNAGQVVGISAVGDLSSRAFLWDKGKMTQLGDSSVAHSINEKGQVVGSLRTNGMNQHAVLWDNGTMLDLGTLGGSRSEAYDINDAGKVVGYAYMSNQASHAFIWKDGKMFDLNNLLPPNSGWTLTSAKAINNNGQIVGSGVFNNQGRAFLLTPITVAQ